MTRPTKETRLGKIRAMCETMAEDMETMIEDEEDDDTQRTIQEATNALLEAKHLAGQVLYLMRCRP